MLRLMGAAPKEVVPLGAQPESTDWGTALTPRVDAAENGFLEAAMTQLAKWAEDFSGSRFATGHPRIGPNLAVRSPPNSAESEQIETETRL